MLLCMLLSWYRAKRESLLSQYAHARRATAHCQLQDTQRAPTQAPFADGISSASEQATRAQYYCSEVEPEESGRLPAPPCYEHIGPLRKHAGHLISSRWAMGTLQRRAFCSICSRVRPQLGLHAHHRPSLAGGELHARHRPPTPAYMQVPQPLVLLRLRRSPLTRLRHARLQCSCMSMSCHDGRTCVAAEMVSAGAIAAAEHQRAWCSAQV